MKYSEYPSYKDSGVEWLGEIPSEWNRVKTAYLFSAAMGQTILKEDLIDDGKYPVYSATAEDKFFGRINQATVKLDKNDIVIPARGNSIGYVKLVKDTATTTQTTIYCKPLTHTTNTKYVYYYMLGLKANLFYFVQTAIPQITVSEVLSNPLLMPPLQEQQTIANYLDKATAKIDTLIEKQTSLIELLKEKRQAVISTAVTRGLDNAVTMKDSRVEWLGEIPEHWAVYRIGNLFTEAVEYGKTDLPILRVSIHDGVSDREYSSEEMDRKVARSEDRSKYKCVEPDDLVYNMMRAWQGGFGAVKVNGLVSPAYVVARPMKAMSTSYIELLLRTIPATEELRRYSRGITDFRLRLYWSEFKNIKVVLPPKEEIDEILVYITNQSNKIDSLVKKADRAIVLLKERRIALISAAVSGKIDVREEK